MIEFNKPTSVKSKITQTSEWKFYKTPDTTLKKASLKKLAMMPTTYLSCRKWFFSSSWHQKQKKSKDELMCGFVNICLYWENLRIISLLGKQCTKKIKS